MNDNRLLPSVALVTFLIATFVFVPVQAQTTQGTHSGHQMQCEESFRSMDTDGDGKVSMEEFMAGPHRAVGDRPLESSFKAADTDGDGMLSKEEFCAGKGAHGGTGKTQ